MSQHDFDIANQGFPATRADLNNALQALASASSGATAPSTTYANQFWYDTANNILKFRNEDNDAWIDLLYLDQTNDAVARLDVDNIRIDGNTISSTDTNGDITLDPDGTGDTIIASGNLGVGTTSPGGLAEFYKAGTSEVLIGTDNGGTAQLSLYETDDGTKEGLLKYDGTNNRIHLATSGAPNALVIPRDSGYVGMGVVPTGSWNLQVASSSGSSRIRMQNSTTGTADGDGGSVAMEGNTFVLQNSESGNVKFEMGGSERMRIESSNGALLVGKTDTSTTTEGAVLQAAGLQSFTRASDVVLRIRRNTNDGTLIQFLQDANVEGTITVSGTTVSYNGGHLSRWSQLADNTKDTSIVKGTVMTNLDQMAVWHHEAQSATYYEEGDELPEGVSVGDEKTPAVAAYDEDNEQLNCMAVSSVEGDANVAGVFVNWDEDDEDYTADMNIAMTGDMVIRIAQGTTVARGDLLMSAGDGTAKAQGDDIVRSKTIAKVTSTNVSHTYDDGSYLVPCVLMAC